MLTIRTITESDAAQYYEIRLLALREHPESFSATTSSWQARSLEWVGEWLRDMHPETRLFGAFEDEQIAGLTMIARPSNNPKRRHRASIYQVYVAPEFRRQQVGERLMRAAIDFASDLPELEEIEIAVTVGNLAATKLYLRSGFQPSHIEPRHMKIDGVYYDIEWMYLRIDKKSQSNTPI